MVNTAYTVDTDLLYGIILYTVNSEVLEKYSTTPTISPNSDLASSNHNPHESGCVAIHSVQR